MQRAPALAGLAFVSILVAPGADASSEYQVPSAELVDIVDAPPTPAVRLSPDRHWLLLLEEQTWTTIAELSRRELHLAGVRIRPSTNGPSRQRAAVGLRLVRIHDGSHRAVVGLPEEPRLGNVRWSPDSRYVAFTHTTARGIEPWLLELSSGSARRLADVRLNLAASLPPRWLPSSDGLLCALVPAARGDEPEAAEVPIGPTIEESTGRKAPARTYQDLLRNPYDEALFDHYFSAQLARIDLDGRQTLLGAPALLWSAAPSPSGQFLLVQSLHRPYSYHVPASRFPRRIEVWDARGALVHRLADLPLQEEIPMAFGSVATGPRAVGWRADAPATLFWAEALDGGDARRQVPKRDRLFLLAAPFRDDPRLLATLGLRFSAVHWGSDSLALIDERWWKSRRTRTWRVAPGTTGGEPQLLFDRSYEDRYTDPGTPQTKPGSSGQPLLVTVDGSSILLIGRGASEEGDRPFLASLDLDTMETRHLLRSTPPHYEYPIALLDDDGERVLLRRESPSEPPNYFVRDTAGDALRALTHLPHPTPQLAAIGKELIRYRRDDGVELTATLYTPPGYSARRDGPLPLLVWAYPREYKSAAAASQVRDSPLRFDRISGGSPLIWVARGYAVLDDPAMPIVGEGESEPNDSYVEQLVSSAAAAVAAVVERGVAERGRIAVGGHSYGAFMTANLLSHSDLFAAGVARSGAYNRTLTPFGFQSEERSVWEAPEVYFAMSPFLHAHKLRAPLLLIHGEVDNNSGTFPLQTRRYYAALKGHGVTSRMVMLPHESHGYRARESVLHMLWETERWLDRYVARGGAAATPSGNR